MENPISLKKYTDWNGTQAPQARQTENEIAEHFCQVSQESAQFGYGYFRSDPTCTATAITARFSLSGRTFQS